MKFMLTGRILGRPSLVTVSALGLAAFLMNACSTTETLDADSGGGGQSPAGGSATGDGGTGGSPVSGPGGQGGEGGVAAPEVEVAELAELAVKSADSYDDNAYGIISGTTLAGYHKDWEANRPAGVTGKLVILQVLASGQAAQVIVSNEKDGVYSYVLPTAKVAQARSNGLSNFETDIPDGPTADALLKLYGIDPTKDFVVLTFEAPPGTASSVVQSVGRAWVFFNYWGWPKERLAILNGSINVNGTLGSNDPQKVQIAATAQQKFSLPKDNGTKSFKDLYRDQTVVSVSAEEIIAVLEEPENGALRSKVRIVDARGGAEALGLKKATNTGRTTCASYDSTTPGNPLNKKCSTPFEGRIRGANSVPWTGFLQDLTNGYRFLSPADAKALFDAQSGWVDGTHEFTIQYCRTNQRSTVTGMVANLILGYPTRLYETSFIEWGHLSAGPADVVAGDVTETFPNKSLLPEASPFRTDLAAYTEHAVLNAADSAAYVPGGTLGVLTQPVTWVAGPNYNDEADVNPPSTAVGDLWPKLNAAGTTTRASIEADRAYLRAE